MDKTIVSTTDPWVDLKQFSSARIAIGRAGGSLVTREWLDFKLAHAKARNAVHCKFDSEFLETELQNFNKKVLVVESQVKNRAEYLQRPDLGRRLDNKSIETLKSEQQSSDLAIIVSDGLSATAIHAHASNLLKILLPKLTAHSWTLAPLVIAKFGRVALEDEIGALLKTKMAIILIGERPGLSSPDSLGVYLIYNPKPCNTDANRNCVSNIRPAGLDYDKAANTILYLLGQARQHELSGVKLKDNQIVLEEEKTITIGSTI